MKSDHKTIKLLVQNVLQRPHAYDWTLQGLGMLRCYLDKNTRLHVWNQNHAVPNVSVVHTHPWHLSSLIVAGQVMQTRYIRCPQGLEDTMGAQWFKEQTLRCGTGGGMCGAPSRVSLLRCNPEHYGEGESYSQTADEIHSSHPQDGTVTLVHRDFLADEEHASVFWPDGQDWVSAEPRKATGLEVMGITRHALHTWFVRNPNYS